MGKSHSFCWYLLLTLTFAVTPGTSKALQCLQVVLLMLGSLIWRKKNVYETLYDTLLISLPPKLHHDLKICFNWCLWPGINLMKIFESVINKTVQPLCLIENKGYINNIVMYTVVKVLFDWSQLMWIHDVCKRKQIALLWLAWENSWHFTMLLVVSPWNELWETSAEIPYWCRTTIQIREYFWLVGNLLHPIRSTTQIWVVTHH